MKRGDRVRTMDGRLGIVAGLDGDVAEVMFPEGEEWVNLVDLVPAQLGAIDQLVETGILEMPAYRPDGSTQAQLTAGQLDGDVEEMLASLKQEVESA